MEDLVRRACQAESEIDIAPSLEALPSRASARMPIDADVLIIGVTDGGASLLPLVVLESHPSARVLLIEVNDAAGELFELRPRRTRLGALTPSDIVRAVLDDRAHMMAWDNLSTHRSEVF